MLSSQQKFGGRWKARGCAHRWTWRVTNRELPEKWHGRWCAPYREGPKVSRQSQTLVNQVHAVQPAKPSSSVPAQRSASHPRMGNQAAQRLLLDGVMQAKLAINQPGDRFEQEADRIADAVMRMPEPANVQSLRGFSVNSIPAVQRVCPECQEELHRSPVRVQRLCSECGEELNADNDRQENIQAKEVPGQTPEVTPTVQAQIEMVRSGGHPLTESARAFFEPRFGRDFSYVRIHADAQAAE